MKNPILSILLILFSISDVCAQNEKAVRTKIEYALISYYNTRCAEIFFQSHYKNNAYIIGFAISVNNVGKVDSVLFTNRTPALDSIVSFNSIKKLFIKGPFASEAFLKYKNTVFVGMALIRKDFDYSIDNLDEFDKNFLNAVPNIEKISKGKAVQFLPTFSMVQVRGRSSAN